MDETKTGRLRVVAVVKPVRLDAVIDALRPHEPRDVLVQQVRGYGRQKGHLGDYEQGLAEGGFLPKVRIEFTHPAERTPEVVAAIRACARTGRIGDGKIFLHPLTPIAETAS